MAIKFKRPPVTWRAPQGRVSFLSSSFQLLVGGGQVVRPSFGESVNIKDQDWTELIRYSTMNGRRIWRWNSAMRLCLGRERRLVGIWLMMLWSISEVFFWSRFLGWSGGIWGGVGAWVGGSKWKRVWYIYVLSFVDFYKKILLEDEIFERCC
jgi:hypothetical protein